MTAVKSGWVASVLLVGCSPNSAVFVPVPENARTLLIATQLDGAFTLRARERIDQTPLRIELAEAEDQSGSAFVLAYSESAKELRIDLGTLQVIKSGEPLATAIPSTFSAGFELPIESGEGTAARELTPGVLPNALQELFFRRRSPCSLVEGRAIPSERIGKIAALLEIAGEEAAYVVNNVLGPAQNTEVRLVRVSGVEAPLLTVEGAPFLAAGDGAEHLWIASRRDGIDDVWSGTIEGGLTKAAERPAATRTSTLVAMISSRAPSAPVLFTLDDAGHLEKLEDDRWSLIWTKPPELNQDNRLAWIAPGIVYAMFDDPSFSDRFLALRYDGSRIDLEEVPSSTGLTALAAHPSYGVLIGSGRGFVFRRDTLGWTDLGLSPIARQISDFAPFRGGILTANLTGGLALYFDGLGYCPMPSNLGQIDQAHDLAPFLDRALVHAKIGDDDALFLITERGAP